MRGQVRKSSEGCNPIKLPVIWNYCGPRNLALRFSEGRTKLPGISFQSASALVVDVRHQVRQLNVWAGILQNGSI